MTDPTETGHTETSHAAYFRFRDDLLGPSRFRVLTGDELCEAGRLIYGDPSGLSLYDIPAPDMAAKGLRFLGRTVIECSVDQYSAAVADAVAEFQAPMPGPAEAMVVDLFCGSGNVGYHLGKRLGHPVFAAELDPRVHQATSHNLDVMNAVIDLRLTDYRDLLRALPARSPRDVFVVEPPWGPAFTAAGLDLAATSPPVPEILADIRRARAGQPCLVVIKTNDQIAHGSLASSFHREVRLRSVTPTPTLPYGANMDFHLYRMDAV